MQAKQEYQEVSFQSAGTTGTQIYLEVQFTLPKSGDLAYVLLLNNEVKQCTI